MNQAEYRKLSSEIYALTLQTIRLAREDVELLKAQREAYAKHKDDYPLLMLVGAFLVGALLSKAFLEGCG